MFGQLQLSDFSVFFLRQTREEKKLEAIVKAFERMEKREQHQRKKEAQQEQSKKPKEKDRASSGAAKSERDSSKSDVTSTMSHKVTKQHSVVRQFSLEHCHDVTNADARL